MTEFETMKNDMNSNLYSSINNDEKVKVTDDNKLLVRDLINKEQLDIMIKNGVSESQSVLVNFLLFDDNIRGVNDIEWNDYGYEDDEYLESIFGNCEDDEREKCKNRQQDEALQCFSWLRLNNYYKDIFDFNNLKIPTYSFKNETWILNVNNFLKIGL
jgi:hypothetical protein